MGRAMAFTRSEGVNVVEVSQSFKERRELWFPAQGESLISHVSTVPTESPRLVERLLLQLSSKTSQRTDEMRHFVTSKLLYCLH